MVTHAPPGVGPAAGTGHDRPLDYGITIARPIEAVPTFLTNVIERITGDRDERMGRAATQVALAGERLLTAGLRSLSAGNGVVATGSSVLRRVLPVAGMAVGAAQVWRGWNELENADSPLDLIHSRSARSGMLSIAASAMWFVPGPAGALAGAGLRFAAAANELDAFKSLDAPTVDIDAQGERTARRVHVFDPTPTNPHDNLRQGMAARSQHQGDADPLGRALMWVRSRLD